MIKVGTKEKPQNLKALAAFAEDHNSVSGAILCNLQLPYTNSKVSDTVFCASTVAHKDTYSVFPTVKLMR